MNNLREKFKKAFPYRPNSHFDKCEQITDDFADKFFDWANTNAYKFPTKITTADLREHFKNNVYGK